MKLRELCRRAKVLYPTSKYLRRKWVTTKLRYDPKPRIRMGHPIPPADIALAYRELPWRNT